MPLGADTVGAVYVRVLADTSGLKNDIERGIGGARGKKAGDQFGKDWVTGVQKRINKINFKREFQNQAKAVAANFTDEMRQAVANGDLTAVLDLDGGPLYKELERIRSTFKLTWKTTAKYFGDALVSEWARIDAQTERSSKKVYRSLQQAFDDLSFDETMEALTNDIARTIPLAIRKAIKETDARDIDFKFDRRAFDAIQEAAERTGRSIGEIEDIVSKRLKPALRDLNLLTLDRFNNSVITLRNSLRRAGTGGAFDVLTNMLAVTVSGGFAAAKGIEALARGIGDAVKQGGGLKNILSNLRALVNIKGLKAVASQIGKVFAALGKNPKALIGALVIIPSLAKVFVSVIGGLIAIVESLAAQLILLGGVLANTAAAAAIFVPIMGALGTAFVATALGAMDTVSAFKAYAKAQAETDPKKRAALMKEYGEALKKLGPNAREAAKALEPLYKEFQRIKKSVGENLFGGFAAALKRSGPLIQESKKGLEGLADAVGDTIDKFLRLGDNAAFMVDFRTMWKGSEEIIRDLGTAARDVFVGLQSVFAAIMPLVLDFTEGIKDGAKTFKDWATSAKGENSIKRFFTDAYNTAKQVWSILGEIGTIIGIVFFSDSAKGAQGTFLDDIEGALERFRKKLEGWEKDGTLTDWFSETRDTFIQTKDAIVDIARELGELNTEENRETFFKMARGLIAIGDGILWVASALSKLSNVTGLGLILKVLDGLFGESESETTAPGVPGSGGGRVGQIMSITGALEALGVKAREISGMIPGLIGGAFTSVGTIARTALSGLGIDVDRVIANVRENFTNLPALIGYALGSIPGVVSRIFFSLLPIVGGVVGQIITRFTNIPTVVQGVMNRLPAIFGSAMSRAYTTVSGWVSRIIARLKDIDWKAALGAGARAVLPFMATGGITSGPTIAGEAGPELVIPLTRPLSQIDASVRNVAAMLRGQGVSAANAAPSTSKIVNNYWTIQSQTGDPEAIVNKVMNRELAMAM